MKTGTSGSRAGTAKWMLLGSLLTVGAFGALGWYSIKGNGLAAIGPITPEQTVLDTQNAFQKVSDTVQPAVVSIRTRRTIQPSPEMSFGSPFGGGQPQSRVVEGGGSGFIVRPDGWILTNDHVVADADTVIVTLDDGREFTGTVKRDFQSDLAAVKIDATNLQTLQLAESSEIKVGSWAVAFGSPFGLSETMTVGIVSALGRETVIGTNPQDVRFYPDLLQTDASINPGNSGGPLLDITGRVIGVNVAIGSPTGGSVGIGFAIPSYRAQFVLEQLVEKGVVTRGFLGFTPEDLTPAMKARYKVENGALVVGVLEDSPAAKAGLQVEDVITQVNGKALNSDLELREQIMRAAPGSDIRLTVSRGGKTQELTAKVEAAPTPQGTRPDRETPEQNQGGQLGMQLEEISPAVAQRLRVPATTKGVFVAGINTSGVAAQAGLQPGDIIVRINGQDVTTLDQAESAIRSIATGDISMVIKRGNNRVLAIIER